MEIDDFIIERICKNIVELDAAIPKRASKKLRYYVFHLLEDAEDILWDIEWRKKKESDNDI